MSVWPAKPAASVPSAQQRLPDGGRRDPLEKLGDRLSSQHSNRIKNLVPAVDDQTSDEKLLEAVEKSDPLD